MPFPPPVKLLCSSTSLDGNLSLGELLPVGTDMHFLHLCSALADLLLRVHAITTEARNSLRAPRLRREHLPSVRVLLAGSLVC